MHTVIMGAFGPLDMLDPFDDRTRRPPLREADVERRERRDEVLSPRWSFSFDGWRRADLDAEYVLA